MKIIHQQKKFIINYSKTSSSQFLKINILVGPIIPVKAGCNPEVTVSLTYSGNNTEALTPKKQTVKQPQREAILINFCARIFTWGSPPPGKNARGRNTQVTHGIYCKSCQECLIPHLLTSILIGRRQNNTWQYLSDGRGRRRMEGARIWLI